MFKSKTREDWCNIMEGTDICFAPILTMAEAPKHPHKAARVSSSATASPSPPPPHGFRGRRRLSGMRWRRRSVN